MLGALLLIASGARADVFSMQMDLGPASSSPPVNAPRQTLTLDIDPLGSDTDSVRIDINGHLQVDAEIDLLETGPRVNGINITAGRITLDTSTLEFSYGSILFGMDVGMTLEGVSASVAGSGIAAVTDNTFVTDLHLTLDRGRISADIDAGRSGSGTSAIDLAASPISIAETFTIAAELALIEGPLLADGSRQWTLDLSLADGSPLSFTADLSGQFAGIGGSLRVDDSDLQARSVFIAPAPEPASAVMLMSLAGIALTRRRRGV